MNNENKPVPAAPPAPAAPAAAPGDNELSEDDLDKVAGGRSGTVGGYTGGDEDGAAGGAASIVDDDQGKLGRSGVSGG